MSLSSSSSRLGGTAFIGALLALAAGCSYGFGGAFSQIVRAQGFSVMQVCFAQYACAAIILAVLVVVKFRPTMSVRDMALMALLGAISALSTYFYYMAIDLISVSAGVALQFQYVWMAVAIESVCERKRPGKWTVAAAILIMVGSFFGSGMADEVFAGGLTMNLFGLLCAMICALFYGAFIYFSGKVAPDSEPVSKTFFGVVGGCIVITALMPFNGGFSFDFVGLAPWGVLMSFVMSIIPVLGIVAANSMISGGLVAVLTSSELPVAVIAGVILLGEALTPMIIGGVVTIIFAIAMSERDGVAAPPE